MKVVSSLSTATMIKNHQLGCTAQQSSNKLTMQRVATTTTTTTTKPNSSKDSPAVLAGRISYKYSDNFIDDSDKSKALMVKLVAVKTDEQNDNIIRQKSCRAIFTKASTYSSTNMKIMSQCYCLLYLIQLLLMTILDCPAVLAVNATFGNINDVTRMTTANNDKFNVIVKPKAAAAATDNPLSRSSDKYVLLDSRDVHLDDKLPVNVSHIIETLFKRKAYSRYWSAEQKWDDLFKRMMSVQGEVKQLILRNALKDAEYYADISLSKRCGEDLNFIQNYAKNSTNFRWALHMADSMGKSEPGMLTGNLAHLGHVIQCIRVRAPARASNDSFDERFFVQQTANLGERFRGKYCLASFRPVMPTKPRLVSRFSRILNESLLSSISYTGEPLEKLKQRARQLTVPSDKVYAHIEPNYRRLDQIPFESELYAYLIAQRNFMYTLPRYMGLCYPSSCSQDDVRMLMQKTVDDQHQVVDFEFECEQELESIWKWFKTPRLVSYVLLTVLVVLVVSASLARYIIVDKMRIKRSKLSKTSSWLPIMDALDLLSMDKCAGILFVKTKQASPYVDWTRLENNRSTSIDALRGFLILILIYSQLVLLGCLPVPFMWSKWADAMFPFFRSPSTQLFVNVSIWSEAFYMISAYLIGMKLLENHRPRQRQLSGEVLLFKTATTNSHMLVPNFFIFMMKRYVRLATPMLAFILLNYVWPQLSNGFVMQDQANKLMNPCDSFGWTNMLMFHNQHGLNETCLWPSHVSASFFQLHLLSYPILVLCLMCLYSEFSQTESQMHLFESLNCKNINRMTSTNTNNGGLRRSKLFLNLMQVSTLSLILLLALLGAIHSALQASNEELIVPFLIDYIDYDNYQRVLEWTVVPTYNHLTSYMIGTLLAYLVVRKRARLEARPMSLTDPWFYNNNNNNYGPVDLNTSGRFSSRNEDSLESVRSASTQELQLSTDAMVASFHRPNYSSQMQHCKFKFSLSSSAASSSNTSENNRHAFDEDDYNSSVDGNETKSFYLDMAKSLIAVLVIFITLTSSWYWNGLGQPMTTEQTFWFVLATKLAFCCAFGYLFLRHFALRRNANNPWMITRFLVPIGRMSLTMFYMSWLVIWFDLLSSPYQWHPSHYFIFEKFTEIIFITLILSMFVYGAFEGIIKRVQYAKRLDRVHKDKKYLKLMRELQLNGSNLSKSSLRRQQVKPFESFFDPLIKKMLNDNETDDNDANASVAGVSYEQQQQLQKQQQVVGMGKCATLTSGALMKGFHQGTTTMPVGEVNNSTRAGANIVQSFISNNRDQLARDQQQQQHRSNLTPVDQYKLNAELRANYSFASIGLYESAGATGDLTQFRGSQASFQPTPALPTKRNNNQQQQKQEEEDKTD